MVFLDLKLNLGEERKGAAEFRPKLPKQSHIENRAAVNESFAESVVDGRNIKTTFDFFLILLKRRSVVRAEKATLHVQNRTDLRKNGMETGKLGIR